MIFTPRSWPSRPGLATRMRSGRAGIDALLEPRRIAVLAEDVAVDVGDLAEGAHRLHGGDQRRHQILARRGGFPHPRQRLARGRRVALPRDAPDAPPPLRLPHEGRPPEPA